MRYRPSRVIAAINGLNSSSMPWSTPLEDWPKERLVSLPRGISRHVVRFVRIGGIVYAIKEINQALADHEYEVLRTLAKTGVPVVQAIHVLRDHACERAGLLQRRQRAVGGVGRRAREARRSRG